MKKKQGEEEQKKKEEEEKKKKEEQRKQKIDPRLITDQKILNSFDYRDQFCQVDPKIKQSEKEIERLKTKGVFETDPDEILSVKFMTKKVYCHLIFETLRALKILKEKKSLDSLLKQIDYAIFGLDNLVYISEEKPTQINKK